jgi:hypothetical protein
MAQTISELQGSRAFVLQKILRVLKNGQVLAPHWQA